MDLVLSFQLHLEKAVTDFPPQRKILLFFLECQCMPIQLWLILL